MYIHGSFINKKGDTCAVHILTNGDRASELVIGEEDTGVFFSDDPVEISDESNDTFDAMLRHSASIHLLCRDMVSDFYCDNCRDAVVNVFVNDACVFAGFLEPLTYSQSYNEYLDEVELSCIDVLSALQYSKYKNVGASGVDYEKVKASAKQRTFLDIMKEIAVPILKDIDITGNHSVSVLFDGSKAVDDTEANRYNIFTKIAIADLLFFGDEEDDVWQQDEIMEEIMRYLNLHIVQCGFTFYIFSWETVKALGTITWHDITTDAATATQRTSTDITNANAADTATTIDMCEAFNQLLLTDDITKTESIIDSPLDDSYLTSPFRNKQKVMTEYSSEGEGRKATRAIYAMAHGEKNDYANSTVTYAVTNRFQPSQVLNAAY